MTKRLLTVACMASLFVAPAGAAEPSTAMFRADAAHLGVYDSSAPTLRSVRWRFHVNASLISSPAVADGMVYVGSSDGKIYAIKRSDGTSVWHFQTQGPVSSSPAVWNGIVYGASVDGYVYALDAPTGQLKWRFKTEGERRFTAPGIHGIIPKTEMMPDPYDLFISSPTIDNGTLYIGSGDHNVYAIDAATGSLRWKFATGDVVHASPAVSEGVVYIGSWDRYLYALDAATGAVRWKFLTGDDQVIHNQIGIVSSAAIADGVVYFGGRDSKLYALDARDGSLRWKHDEHGSWVIASPAIYDGAVYFTTSDERIFFALDAKTGGERFRAKYGAFAYSSPSIAGGVAYYGTFDGVLYGIDAKTGKIVATFESDGARKNRAVHLDAHGDLDVDGFYPDPTLNGIIIGLDRIFTLGSIVGAAAISDGTLYVSSTDGTLYALQ
jgi:eukaryotic-like serine/threonine-protein kinase